MKPTPSDWEDMSDYVVHFTKVTPDLERDRERSRINRNTDYASMLSILANGVIQAKHPFGVGYKAAPCGETQKAVCFSEIPPGHWQRLVDRRGTKYGIAFHKSVVIERGGGPIWYAFKDTPYLAAIRRLMSCAGKDASADIWKLTPFIDAPGDYPANGGGAKPRRFEWEREWRRVGDFRFAPHDVAFLLIPEEHHDDAHAFFVDAQRENLGPAYFCPYVDPLWDREKILHTLDAVDEEDRDDET